VRGASDRAKELVEPVLRILESFEVNNAFVALVKSARRRPIEESKLRVSPDRLGFDVLLGGHAHTSSAANGLPLSLALDGQTVKDFVNSAHKMLELLARVAGRRRDAKALFADCDCRVVDGLDVDAVVIQQRVRRRLRERSIADENGNDMRRTRDYRDITTLEARLELASVQLLKPPVTKVLLLIRDASLSTCHRGRGQICREDEPRRIRPNSVDEVS